MVKLYFILINARIRCQMQYRVSFLFDLLANLFSSFTDLAAMIIIFTHTPALKGWTLAETAFLFGLTNTSFALAEMIGGGFDVFQLLIREGKFDQMLVRPLGHFFQVMTSEFVLRRFGRLTQGLAIIVVALHQILASGTAAIVVLLLLPVIAGGTLFYMALFITQATTAIWTVEGLEVFNIITYGGNEVLSHPLDVFHPVLRRFFTYILPMAFINYIPVAAIIGKPLTAAGVPPWTAWFSPLFGLGAFLLARRFWAFGVRHYQSTGS
ncbi:MAG TPA: ABC transporter permease [Firmicutes bacterium]|nr:ABC transporter permease [Bacillota bacterium]HCX71774.1 ABC transporter permease [Bacillota bacterium]